MEIPLKRQGFLGLALFTLFACIASRISKSDLSLAASPPMPAVATGSSTPHLSLAATLPMPKIAPGDSTPDPSLAASSATQTVTTVQRISRLSYKEFRSRFLETQTPVVITDLANTWDTHQWTIEHINRTCGSRRVNLGARGLQLIRSLHHTERAAMDEQFQQRHGITLDQITDQLEAGMTISDFVSFLVSQRGFSTARTPDYQEFSDFLYPYNMHDEFLSNLCPELLGDVTMSRYQQPTGGQGGQACRQYPRLWMSPSGSRTYPTHLHGSPSNVFSLQVAGEKVWNFWSYEHADRLHPESMSSEMGDELFWGNPAATEGKPGWVGNVPRMEAVVKAGDLLYVPCELIHNVHTVQESITLSYALVDHKAATCARNLHDAGSWTFAATFKRIQDGLIEQPRTASGAREYFSPKQIITHDYESAKRFAPAVDKDLLFDAFRERYC